MWKQVATCGCGSVVGARSSHQVSAVGDVLYLFGGEHQPRTPIDSKLYSLTLGKDGVSGEWSQVEVKGEAPEPRVGHAQAVIGDKLYVFGGRQGVTMEEKPLGDLFCFDTKSKTWSACGTQGDSPCPRSFHQMVSVGKRLFVFGGCAAVGRLADLFCFDTEKNVWTRCADAGAELKPRGGAAVAASQNQNQVLVMGGFAGQEMDDIWIYDVQTDKWARSAYSLPRARSVAASSCLKRADQECILVFGGEVDPSDRGHEGAGGFDSEITLLSGADWKPSVLASANAPPARGWGSGTSWGDSAFAIYGGLAGNDECPERLSDVWILDASVGV
eukprot:CAMPEP_0203796920 /NCGR_PEP_ID=MMETSP0100_2-20121128/8283_1 /ASSEMBLY_ACC=CAM_ASM_000210 /TAXON_ID=96639 /ORGANISM=" , Strain NY0313808BC1" /LENGTH=329 /DNA_ID=CAMNT_0050702053 /DNA_START=1604 /DNA_END=2593 /DNA_ORIENTATION=-